MSLEPEAPASDADATYRRLLLDQPTACVEFGGATKQVKQKDGKEKQKDGKQGKEKEKQGKQGKDKDKQGKQGKQAKDKDKQGKDIDLLLSETGPAGEVGFDVSPERRLYLVVFGDRQEHEPPPDELLDRHLEHLRGLAERGVLETAAAFATGDRGLQLLIAQNEEEVEAIVKSDPLVEANYYASYQIDELLVP